MSSLSCVSDDALGVVLAFLEFEELRKLVLMRIFSTTMSREGFWRMYIAKQPLREYANELMRDEKKTALAVLLDLNSKEFLLRSIIELQAVRKVALKSDPGKFLQRLC